MSEKFYNKNLALLTAAALLSGSIINSVVAKPMDNPMPKAANPEIEMLKQRLDAQERAINDFIQLNTPTDLRRHMHRLLSDPYVIDSSVALVATPDVFGRMNVVDGKDKITVTLEMPGMEKKDINIELKDYVLTISGEKKDAQEVKEGDYFLQERQFGTFNRSVSLPENIDVNKISSQLKNGVLTIVVPKTEVKVQEVKKIPIE